MVVIVKSSEIIVFISLSRLFGAWRRDAVVILFKTTVLHIL